MGKVFVITLVLFSTLIFAQTQLQPIKPNIPFIPQLPTTVQESDLLGRYGSVWKIFWDGWEGTLVFQKDGKGYIEDENRNKYNLTYTILRNPQDSISSMTGPGYTGKKTNLGHRVVFFVDFANTPNNQQDDQRFDGYIFTQTLKTMKRAIAGITWWDNIPFGFYATYWYDIPG
ncbi:hypothetical protein [Pseudothermotoga elfii]|uniref:hypothetical protein n=1 Tax=Pseudothermotoga elfii TaxID=38322 RepID=UPI0003FE0F29|nr:hypothetical protein [Pseudothermotoga elfii]